MKQRFSKEHIKINADQRILFKFSVLPTLVASTLRAARVNLCGRYIPNIKICTFAPIAKITVGAAACKLKKKNLKINYIYNKPVYINFSGARAHATRTSL